MAHSIPTATGKATPHSQALPGSVTNDRSLDSIIHGTERAILRRRSPCGGVETPSTTTIPPMINHTSGAIVFPPSILACSFSRHKSMPEKAIPPAACPTGWYQEKESKVRHLVCDRCTKKEKLHRVASNRRFPILA
jgi:hypothetical protein